MKKFLVLILMIVIAVAGLSIFNYISTQKNEERKRIDEEQRQALLDEINQNEIRMKEEIEKKNAMIDAYNRNVSDEIELLLMTETGTVDLFHDKTPENYWWADWLIDSYVELNAKYTAIIAIRTADIYAKYDEDGKLLIIYDSSRIALKSVEISDVVTDSHMSLYGLGYTPEEMAALINVAREYVLEQVSNNEMQFTRAEENLRAELLRIAVNLEFESENVIIRNISEQAFANAE